MAVTSRNLRTNYPRQSMGRRLVRVTAPQQALRRSQTKQPPTTLPAIWINRLLWAGVVVLLALLLGTLSGIFGVWIDDLRYGRPRVSHLVANVGHESAQGLPSEFMAINLNRRVVVLEFPGGDASKARTLIGPYLFGAGEDLTPITLSTHDLNNDARPELLVNIKNEQLIYINQADGFRMITAAEQASLLNQQQ
jgi:hypothetical protein